MPDGIGLNGALWLGYSGLSVAQQQINTAGRNLANSDTPGASRQRVAVSEDTTVLIGGQNLSIGVYALGITGTRSQYLDSLVQTENSNLGASTSTDDFMTLVQNALQEALSSTQTNGTETTSQTGLEAATTNLFNAWSKLSADPTNSSLRDAVSSAALAFTTTAKGIYGNLQTTKSSAFTDAGTETDTANSLISQIAKLNQQIASAEVGSQDVNGIPINQASDMRDQREALIEQLSSIVNVTVSQNTTNASMVDIQLADTTSGSYQLATSGAAPTPSAGTLIINGTTVTVSSGDDLATVAANINSSVSNVTATVSNGNLVLNSLSSITAAGTSNLATALSVAQGPATSTPIVLVKGGNGGGVTYTGAVDSTTYSLTIAGSSDGVTGYGADKSLFVLAQNGTTGTLAAGPTGGSVGGLVTFDNQTLGYEDQDTATFTSGSTIIDRFNTFINNIATTVNDLTATGYDLNGNAATSNANGGSFFYDESTSAASVGAWNLGVNSIYDYTNTAYDSDDIPAALTQVSSGTSNDGSLATKIGGQVNNSDLYPAYATFVSDVGSLAQAASTNLSAQKLVSSQAVTSQQSYSGISTDEEMTDLTSFQRAFEANSRFINTINEMYKLLTTNFG